MVATDWKTRQLHLSAAYECLARLHNSRRITKPLPEKVGLFFERPFEVISKGEFSQALCAKINDPDIKELSRQTLIGSVDQLTDTRFRKRLRELYFSSTY
jgi:hypothetical protein